MCDKVPKLSTARASWLCFRHAVLHSLAGEEVLLEFTDGEYGRYCPDCKDPEPLVCTRCFKPVDEDEVKCENCIEKTRDPFGGFFPH